MKLSLAERIRLSEEASAEIQAERLARADAVLARTGNEVIFIHCRASNQPDFPIADKLYRDFMDGWTESQVLRVVGILVWASVVGACVWWTCHVLSGGGF